MILNMKFDDIIINKGSNMQFPYLEASKTSSSKTTSFHPTKFLGFLKFTTFTQRTPIHYPSISCNSNGQSRNPSKSANRRVNHSSPKTKFVKKGKENVWSVDNEFAKEMETAANERSNRKKKDGKSVVKKRSGSNGGAKVLVSGAMLVEVETVLQTQEPVIRPAWSTFSSSISGIWKGVGAVFSPINAEMEPIDVGTKNKYLYDCYTLARVNEVPSSSRESTSVIERKINWVTLNPNGEIQPKIEVDKKIEGPPSGGDSVFPNFDSFDLEVADLMEKDYMGMEPGLVYFEDGSYSRGSVEIPVELDEFGNCLSQILKFEQCLVKGCHKRLRIVHTIEFNNGGTDIQIMRVAVYEEQWAGPANVPEQSDSEFDLKPFSQRKRIIPSQLTGQWKVFEVSATPIYVDDTSTEENIDPTFVYLCMETLKKRSSPDAPVYFREEEMLDMQDTTVLWLTGGVTSYVDVDKDGILCIGVGWYSDEGINLVMERDYGVDGKLRDVRSKTEVKRRWSDPLL